MIIINIIMIIINLIMKPVKMFSRSLVLFMMKRINVYLNEAQQSTNKFSFFPKLRSFPAVGLVNAIIRVFPWSFSMSRYLTYKVLGMVFIVETNQKVYKKKNLFSGKTVKMNMLMCMRIERGERFFICFKAVIFVTILALMTK